MGASEGLGLNGTVEVSTTGNHLVSGIIPKPGRFDVGDVGIDFVPEDGRGRVQLAWAELDRVEVDLFRGHVRSLEAHTATGLVHTLVLSDGVSVLRCAAAHMGRDRMVDVNARARAAATGGGGILGSLRALLGRRPGRVELVEADDEGEDDDG